MSVEPELPPAAELAEEPPKSPWYVKLSALLFCLFCFEVGVFLIVVPWLDSWGRNWWFWLRPEWRSYFVGDSFRGAITGIGILNLLVGIRETLRLRHLR